VFANIQEIVDLPGAGSRGTRMLVADITLETSYPTGGTAGIANALGVGKILSLEPVSCGGYSIDYLVATDKLKCYQQPAAAGAGPSPEVPNATNMSAVVAHVFVVAQ
jgi:hypothetical protein